MGAKVWDSCAKVTTANMDAAGNKCQAATDGATPAKKCCQVTFSAKLTYGSAGTGTDMAKPDAGSSTDGKKYCYKSGGDLRLKTTAEGFNAASLWCDAKNTAKTTATACVCGASSIFMIGFSLLAILATLWK